MPIVVRVPATLTHRPVHNVLLTVTALILPNLLVTCLLVSVLLALHTQIADTSLLLLLVMFLTVVVLFVPMISIVL